MSDYPSYKTRPISAISFFIGAILIVALLLISVYFGRKYVLSAQKPNDSVKISKESDEKQKQDKAKEEASKKENEAKEKKAAEEKKKADEAAAKAAEEKKKQEEAAAEQQAQANAAANAADPSHVASTGPEDTLATVLGVFALSYAAYRFYDSRKNASLNNHQ